MRKIRTRLSRVLCDFFYGSVGVTGEMKLVVSKFINRFLMLTRKLLYLKRAVAGLDLIAIKRTVSVLSLLLSKIAGADSGQFFYNYLLKLFR